MLQDSKTKIDIIRMQLRRALQAGQLESQAAPDEAQGEPRAPRQAAPRRAERSPQPRKQTLPEQGGGRCDTQVDRTQRRPALGPWPVLSRGRSALGQVPADHSPGPKAATAFLLV